MPKEVYSYDPITGKYCGTAIARESPEDLKQGKTVWHIPGYATENKPPDPLVDHIVIWDGNQWIQKKLDKITKTVTRQLNSFIFESEIKAAFPDVEIKIEGDVNSKASRSLIFHGLPDTVVNNTTLDAIIAAHVLPNTKIEQSSNVSLAIVKVMCIEMQKINPSFPDFATFKTKVNDLLAQK